MEKSDAIVGFFEVVTPWVTREFLFARRNLVLALTPLFFGQFGQTKVLRTPKIMLFPVISGFLPKIESKWKLSRANTTPRNKRGVTTSNNPTLQDVIEGYNGDNDVFLGRRKYGYTNLHWAFINEENEIAEGLLKSAAQLPNGAWLVEEMLLTEDNRGRFLTTPFVITPPPPPRQIRTMLLSVDCYQRTPLHLAICEKHLEVTEKLLQTAKDIGILHDIICRLDRDKHFNECNGEEETALEALVKMSEGTTKIGDKAKNVMKWILKSALDGSDGKMFGLVLGAMSDGNNALREWVQKERNSLLSAIEKNESPEIVEELTRRMFKDGEPEGEPAEGEPPEGDPSDILKEALDVAVKNVVPDMLRAILSAASEKSGLLQKTLSSKDKKSYNPILGSIIGNQKLIEPLIQCAIKRVGYEDWLHEELLKQPQGKTAFEKLIDIGFADVVDRLLPQIVECVKLKENDPTDEKAPADKKAPADRKAPAAQAWKKVLETVSPFRVVNDLPSTAKKMLDASVTVEIVSTTKKDLDTEESEEHRSNQLHTEEKMVAMDFLALTGPETETPEMKLVDVNPAKLSVSKEKHFWKGGKKVNTLEYLGLLADLAENGSPELLNHPVIETLIKTMWTHSKAYYIYYFFLFVNILLGVFLTFAVVVKRFVLDSVAFFDRPSDGLLFTTSLISVCILCSVILGFHGVADFLYKLSYTLKRRAQFKEVTRRTRDKDSVKVFRKFNYVALNIEIKHFSEDVLKKINKIDSDARSASKTVERKKIVDSVSGLKKSDIVDIIADLSCIAVNTVDERKESIMNMAKKLEKSQCSDHSSGALRQCSGRVNGVLYLRFKRLDLRFLEIKGRSVYLLKGDPEFPGISGQVYVCSVYSTSVGRLQGVSTTCRRIRLTDCVPTHHVCRTSVERQNCVYTTSGRSFPLIHATIPHLSKINLLSNSLSRLKPPRCLLQLPILRLSSFCAAVVDGSEFFHSIDDDVISEYVERREMRNGNDAGFSRYRCLVRLCFGRSEFFEVVTPLGGARVFICASESCFGSHAFVSWPIWFNGLPKLCSFRWYPVLCRKVRESGGCHAQIRRRATKGG
eukprot:sb/3461429/